MSWVHCFTGRVRFCTTAARGFSTLFHRLRFCGTAASSGLSTLLEYFTGWVRFYGTTAALAVTVWAHYFTGLVCFCGGCAKYTHGACLSTLFHRLSFLWFFVCFVVWVKLVLQPVIGCLYCCNSCASCLLLSFIIYNANFQNCFALYLYISYFSSAWHKLLPHIPYLFHCFWLACIFYLLPCIYLSAPISLSVSLSPISSPSPSLPSLPFALFPFPLSLLSCFPPFPLGYTHQHSAYKYIFMFLWFLIGTLFCFFPRHSPRQCSKWGWR